MQSLEKLAYANVDIKEDNLLEHLFKYWKEYNILSILVLERPR